MPKRSSTPLREARAMIAAMAPHLHDGSFIFCSTKNPAIAAACAEHSIGMFVEDEGRSFILPLAHAAHLDFDCSQPMCMITLTVHSALDGVGLISAVANQLAGSGIACNVVAAYHHDHIFVPKADSERALASLRHLQNRTLR